MKRVFASLLAALALIGGEASASVLYRWETISTSPKIAGFFAEFEITSKAFADGSLYFTTGTGCKYGPNPDVWTGESCFPDPDSPFVRFSARITEANGFPDPYGGNTISINRHLGTGWLFPTHSSIDVTFHGREIESGILYMNDGESSVEMHGANGIWIIDRYGSDAFTCHTGCSGATGRFVRVPEPGALSMLLPVFASMILTRRRKTARA